MKQVLLGDTGYEISKMGLGLAALGRPGYINLGHGTDLGHDYSQKKMMAAMHHMLDVAVQSDINYIDAAQSYGMSEDFLSEWLKTLNSSNQDIIVGSKWGYTYTALWKVEAEKHEVKEHSLIVLNRQWNLSRKRLKPHLKLYQVHSATFESGILENTKVLDRLAEIQDTGTLIGITLTDANQAEVLEQALKISVEGRKLFETVQLTYNLLESSTADAIKKAADAGLGIVIKEGLANGRLTERNTAKAYEPLLKYMKTLADDKEVGIDAIALAYILHNPAVHVVLSGAATEEHLYANLKALGIELTPKEIDTLGKYKMEPTAYWAERKTLKWN